ncbi:branched-chain amino acid transport system substrate-binding protein [Crossiella equi]|uniref:Branched-chain amino acid transport system substrate-binding protein n=1 Tax=Crossiella equi TaxID=130796 RepID=A0ABS5A7L3_9PSEU|nr:substrate-binding protein [Crossiella equi]MBP2472565.1 branched-chain amino acid transport system substrate-binding protein [Crossiella equi]
MGNLVLTQQRDVALPPGDVFGLLGQDKSAGWLFGADYTAFTVGALVRFELPLNPADPASPTIEAAGRIAFLDPPHKIVIEQSSPWPGRVSCTMTTTGGGRATTVRLGVEVPQDAVTWLLRQRGYDPLEELAGPRTIRIGVLVSKSGPASIFGPTTENLARMAADEVNADGGVDGCELQVVVRDDASSPDIGAEQFTRLVRADGCRVIVTNCTSAVFPALARLARRLGVLLVHTPINEGGRYSPYIVRLGERPSAQLRAALPQLVAETGGRTFLCGDDYVWPRACNAEARRIVERLGGHVVAERYKPLGTKDFADTIEEIISTGASLVVSTFVGSDEAHFERQSHAAGLRSRCRTLSMAFDESTRELTGGVAAQGVYSAFSYFQEVDSATNTAFLDRYRGRFGHTAAPLSSITESVYEAIHMLASSGALRRDPDLGELSAAMRVQRETALWRSARPGQGKAPLFVAKAGHDGFRIVDR